MSLTELKALGPYIVFKDSNMHKNGWVYFRIAGEIRGQNTSGSGRLTLVQSAFQQYPPWLELNIGDSLRIIDYSRGGYLSGSNGEITAGYRSGTFFKGLSRPWTGIHTLDIICLDAAAEGLWFGTDLHPNGKEATITVLDEGNSLKTELVYTIDLEKDIIKSLRFRVSDRPEGFLSFSYLLDEAPSEGSFSEPSAPNGSRFLKQQGPGMLWLIYLAQGKLVELPAKSY